MNKISKKAAVLWTGGKDSSLAFYEAKLSGYDIINLVTFVPHKPRFLAHPLNLMEYQAKALGIPHHKVIINEPFKESYEEAIYSLKEKYEINTLISGDIAEVGGNPNWIRECSKRPRVNVLTPLWGRDKNELLNKLFLYKLKVIFSCTKEPWFNDDHLLGLELNKDTFEQLRSISAKTGMDICGEQGEYHTLAIDGPIFKKSISINSYSKHKKGDIMYLDIGGVTLKEKHKSNS